ncbi:hypothetical protein OHS18_42110 [Amycolatopsis sp. NBC_00355]|uniref:hypothetical protein n=1 Tax=Amycolatopsis sp. NBC_00355 TaxID=2975957 RepID=UPI002E269E6E
MTALEEKFGRFRKPSSDYEKDKQDRAERMVRNAVDSWASENDIGVRYLPKGSYANNTNVRLDSDVDIAVIHQGFHYYDDGELLDSDKINGSGVSIKHFDGSSFRTSLGASLKSRFGAACDNTGKTAIELAENTGRVKADIVPSYEFWKYYYDSSWNVRHHVGNKVYRLDGSSVVNYPEQQLVNGREKNNKTGGRYKDAVRILKNVENELVAAGKIEALPSYFMECLMYIVPNDYFGDKGVTPLVTDFRNATAHIFSKVKAGETGAGLFEPNGIKPLFSASQPWTLVDASNLVLQAWSYYKLDKA